ncbi:hypothetical protein GCM10023196_057470 [Actinoallomurus vinaceus]|uniref:Uncharacterized protein n=1 Tax=Actinoallomurus vinaceus TaxID=1080074 RepID=A0ABP8UIJ3_9ACTN
MVAVTGAEAVGVGGDAVLIAALAGPILSKTLAHTLTLSIGNHRERNIDLLVRWQNKATPPVGRRKIDTIRDISVRFSLTEVG